MPVASQNGSDVLVFQDVTFRYGATVAVDRVTFSVQSGDFVALIGPNGGGKTTLLKLALGLERPQEGRVLLFGRDAHNFRDWRRIGYVPQDASAFRVRFPATVGEVVSYGEYRGWDLMAPFRMGLSQQVQHAMETVDMWEYRERLISELSIGQQRRVLIARALVRSPEILFLDEPTAGLDVAGQEQFYSLLRHLCHDQGVTVVLVSHDVGVVLHEATKVACINRTLVFHGSSQDLTDADLSRLYGFAVDLVIHRHRD